MGASTVESVYNIQVYINRRYPNIYFGTHERLIGEQFYQVPILVDYVPSPFHSVSIKCIYNTNNSTLHKTIIPYPFQRDVNELS